MKQKHFIDLSKGVTPLVVLACMFVYNAWDNPTAWAYLATHGTYGVLWVLKSQIFPDKSWEAPCGIGYGLVILGGLALYWGTPWMICAWQIEAPLWFLSLCVAIFGIGVFLHFAADMQKDATLKLKRGLITDGLFARTRNPNYLGELLIYGSFSALAMHWYPFVVLAVFMAAIWVPNMLKKDKSISRHEGWAAYKARTGLLFPKIFGRGETLVILLGTLLVACTSQVTPPSGTPAADASTACADGACPDGGQLDAGAQVADAGQPVDTTPCGAGGTYCPEAEYCHVGWSTCGEEPELGTCRFRGEVCDEHPDPVCGCDGLTYTNQCQARLAGVNLNRGGPCEARLCEVGDRLNPCPDRMYCRVPDYQCGQAGYCAELPTECHRDEGLGPVCGCNGVGFRTLCELRMSGTGFRQLGSCDDLRCDSDADCAEGQICEDGRCEGEE